MPKKQIIDDVINDVEALPDERLEEVRDFVQFLRRKTTEPPRSSPDALLPSLRILAARSRVTGSAGKGSANDLLATLDVWEKLVGRSILQGEEESHGRN